MSDDRSPPERAPADAVRRVSILERKDAESRRRGTGLIARDDSVAVEEPLEIRVVVEEDGRRERHAVAITMRTPGHDFELAAGFLFSEGVVRGAEAIWRVSYCATPETPESEGNIVEVHLSPGTRFDAARSSRKVYTTSSCGVCGRGSLELLWTARPECLVSEVRFDAELLLQLPERLRSDQRVFGETGGLHAAALCNAAGEIELLREDVGRHNAVDKLIGNRLVQNELPASESLLLVSGRASFELVQKAIMAGIPGLAAVGAPSSLAVSAAEDHGLTLIGFLDARRFNVYAGHQRIESR